MSLVAAGGYGRGELSPHSDLDLLILLGPKTKVPAESFRDLLYPLWDGGFQVGHAVLTPKQAVARADGDLHAATSLLSARLVVGEARPFEELVSRRDRWLAKDRRALIRRVLREVAARHERVDRAGWSLAPDLKDDAGGLRDVHASMWLDDLAGDGDLDPRLRAAAELLLAVREGLHATVKRKVDRVRMDLQHRVAGHLRIDGEDAADELMAEVHRAARTVEHLAQITSESVLERATAGPRRSGFASVVSPGVRIEDGILALEPSARGDIAAAVRLLAARASSGRQIQWQTLATLGATFDRAPLQRWTQELREAFFDLLAGGHSAGALEILDQVGGWDVLLPEWRAVRGRAQHDPYHRYTVDGHSFLAVEEVTRAIVDGDPIARTAAQEAGRLQTLLLGALLHDIGKGSGEDHSIAGERLARSACGRIGLTADESDEVAALVRWHLLLADTATRRDLDDGAVIGDTADKVASPRLLRLLYILTVADARATGPQAWNEWKAALVQQLYRKTLVALEKGELPTRSDVAARAAEVEAYEPSLAGRADAVLTTLPPSYLDSTTIPDMVDEIRLLLDPPKPGEVRCRIDDGTEAGQAAVTTCVPDRPGALARTAATLALDRIGILRAQAFSTTTGHALQRFIVKSPPQGWDTFRAHLDAAYAGRLALEAALEKKARDYLPTAPLEAEVRILQDASPHSTVVEVRCADALGLLYAIAAALNDLDLDIHVAKIDTLGHRVVDVFYVRTLWGTKLGNDQVAAVERAIAYRIHRLYGS